MNAIDLFQFRKRVPVLIVERVEKRRFGVKKYSHKRLFVGRLSILQILLFGREKYMLHFGCLGLSVVESELYSILSRAKIEGMAYQVVDFFPEKKHFIIYVMTNKLRN